MVLLKTGDGHAGWRLRAIGPRVAVLQRDDQIVRLALQEQLPPRMAPPDRVPAAAEPSSRGGSATRDLGQMALAGSATVYLTIGRDLSH
jgi:hypothetical protein